MKKLLMFALAGISLLAFACQKNENVQDSTPEESQLMKQFLATTYGFLPESIVEHDHCFVAEGDQCFHKEDFWNHYSSGADGEFSVPEAGSDELAADRKHYRWSYLVTKTKNVTIRILPGVPTVWKNAITQAVIDWNALGGGLTFSIQYASSPKFGVVNVSMKTMSNEDYAKAYYPTSNGYPGSDLFINPYFNNILSPNSKTGVIAHEIGHTIGIRHTDSGDGSLITNVSTSCKNNPDPESVMSAEGDFYYGFTTCDREAYKALYKK
ncbi:MAG: hypothetical protein JNN28_17995 [Saprospiraceae bacterium]|nr:hypothetical protein [Saprospiraceae bacterium]